MLKVILSRFMKKRPPNKQTNKTLKPWKLIFAQHVSLHSNQYGFWGYIWSVRSSIRRSLITTSLIQYIQICGHTAQSSSLSCWHSQTPRLYLWPQAQWGHVHSLEHIRQSYLHLSVCIILCTWAFPLACQTKRKSIYTLLIPQRYLRHHLL